MRYFFVDVVPNSMDAFQVLNQVFVGIDSQLLKLRLYFQFGKLTDAII